MKLLKLYIDGFMCYDKAFIDFTEFSAALIVGKQENNDHFANGVGKTSIFKAIEYVLFNHSEVPLEKIIRDDANACRIVLDFLIGEQEYRLSRSRTRKSTDFTLLQRTSKQGTEEEVYHAISEDGAKIPHIDKKVIEGYWHDKSGSRAGDTEKDLAKLIKINQKSFRSTVLFPQNDLSGLPTVTPEKRKGILKEALGLAVYSKLEKIAKDKSTIIVKDIEKNKTLFENMGDPNKDLELLVVQLQETEKVLQNKAEQLAQHNFEANKFTDKINELTTAHSNLENKFATLLNTEKALLSDKLKIETSIAEYGAKKSSVVKLAKEIKTEIDALKETQIIGANIDFSQMDVLIEAMEKKKELVVRHNLTIKNSIETLEELQIPLPNGSVCKNCRKPMTEQDRKSHQEHINQDIVKYQSMIKASKQDVIRLNNEITVHVQNINNLKSSKQQMESVSLKLSSKTKEIQDKKGLHDEYAALIANYTTDLTNKNKDLEQVAIELKSSSMEEANSLKKQIDDEKQKLLAIATQINVLNKEFTHFNNQKAVLQHSIENKSSDKLKKENLEKSLKELDQKIAMYPSVIQAFSSSGIPNLIIQNVLDDLQIESNELLAQLKPGIQLSFSIEKTVEKTGDQVDTLDIKYSVHGKERYYEQLSGGQQLAVAFGLKLGLSFVLQKMVGTDIKFLLLDEIDPSLDKASVDAFVDIIKFFQKDYTILIITHNDRLKDKFQHAILVEQDANMISTAKVVSSW